MNICVVGLGYIGLPTASMFAAHGHQVLGVDRNPAVVSALNQGRIIIEEDHLEALVKEVVARGALRGAEQPELADAFIIAVPTPITEAKKADMSYVIKATESIVPKLRPGNLVVLESTSPVGTVEELMLPILAKSGLDLGRELYIGHSPERVIPGKILDELVHNSRIAGGVNPASSEKIAQLYRCFVEGEIFQTNARTAELCKLTENTFRDINIAFANELAKICENLGANVWEVISLCNKHPRVNIHQPGPGVGGHCIAVDPWFIVEKQPDTARLIRQARLINDSMPGFVAGRLEQALANIEQPKIAVLGVTYKPNVDDTRESPILELMELLREKGAIVSCHDPYARGYERDLLTVAQGADLLLLGVHHQQYARLSPELLGGVMRRRLLYDTRNFIDRAAFTAAGFTVYTLGE